jgi:hypothetical protein
MAVAGGDHRHHRHVARQVKWEEGATSVSGGPASLSISWRERSARPQCRVRCDAVQHGARSRRKVKGKRRSQDVIRVKAEGTARAGVNARSMSR